MVSDFGEATNALSRCFGEVECKRATFGEVSVVRVDVPRFGIECGDNVESRLLKAERHPADTSE
jgi:hypothetical protein